MSNKIDARAAHMNRASLLVDMAEFGGLSAIVSTAVGILGGAEHWRIIAAMGVSLVPAIVAFLNLQLRKSA